MVEKKVIHNPASCRTSVRLLAVFCTPAALSPSPGVVKLLPASGERGGRWDAGRDGRQQRVGELDNLQSQTPHARSLAGLQNLTSARDGHALLSSSDHLRSRSDSFSREQPCRSRRLVLSRAPARRRGSESPPLATRPTCRPRRRARSQSCRGGCTSLPTRLPRTSPLPLAARWAAPRCRTAGRWARGSGAWAAAARPGPGTAPLAS